MKRPKAYLQTLESKKIDKEIQRPRIYRGDWVKSVPGQDEPRSAISV